MNYIDVYKRRISHLGTNPQDRAFKSGILEFRRYLKYSQHTERNLLIENNNTLFDGVILTDKEDENRTSQILLTELTVPLEVGNYIIWNDEHWLVHQSTTSSYQPHQKFYMVRCNHLIKWINEEGERQESWVYLLGNKDSKIKDNYRTWNEMITPQPNKFINIIMPEIPMRRETEIIILGEAWRLVDYDINSVKGINFLSFAETKVNEQRDDIEGSIANVDTEASWTIEAAKERYVTAGETFELIYKVLKNGIVQDVEPTITLPRGFTFTDEGLVQAPSDVSSAGTVIEFSYKGVKVNQTVHLKTTTDVSLSILGASKIRVGEYDSYAVEKAAETTFIIDKPELASVKTTDTGCIVYANERNKVGKLILTAKRGNKVATKQIEIVSLWQVI